MFCFEVFNLVAGGTSSASCVATTVQCYTVHVDSSNILHCNAAIGILEPLEFGILNIVTLALSSNCISGMPPPRSMLHFYRVAFGSVIMIRHSCRQRYGIIRARYVIQGRDGQRFDYQGTLACLGQGKLYCHGPDEDTNQPGS